LTFNITGDGQFVKRSFTPGQVLDLLKKGSVKFVDLQFTDVPGRLRHVSLPTEMMSQEMFSEGVAKLDGSSVKGFVEINESDMLLVPDATTYGVVPWIEDSVKTACPLRIQRAGSAGTRDTWRRLPKRRYGKQGSQTRFGGQR